MTEIVTRLIPETVVEGKRLGRHVHHDPRSLGYTVAEGTPVTVRWERSIPVLDQGNVGSCTGNAATGHLGTAPEYATLAAKLAAGLVLDENEALRLYSAAEVIDGGAGYPPEDQGSSGLSVAKAAEPARAGADSDACPERSGARAFLAAVPAGWEDRHHVGDNEKVAHAVQALRKAIG